MRARKWILGILIGAAHGCGTPAPLATPPAAPAAEAAPADAGSTLPEVVEAAHAAHAPPAPAPESEPPPTIMATSFPTVCPQQPGNQTPEPQQEAALIDALSQLEARYALGGRWGKASGNLQVSPSDAAFSGSLEVTRRAGPIQNPPFCASGRMAPVRVVLRTDEGALDDELEGTALLEDRFDSGTVDDSPLPFVLQIEATLDLTQRRGKLQIADSSLASFKRAVLRATITPFGTLGELTAQAESGSPGASRAAPAPEPLLTWPAVADSSCGEDVTLLPSQGGALRAALRDAVDRLAAQPMAAHYADGTRTTLSVRIEPPMAACGTGRILLPTAAQLETADGRLSGRVEIKLDTSYARLFANTRTDVPWAFRPTELGAHGIRVQDPLTGFAHTGIEAWFGENVGPSEVRFLGWAAGDCLGCDAACKDCSSERRTLVFALSTDR